MGGWLRLAAATAVMVTAWRWLRDWGATAAERWLILPGDELVRDPADMTTLAVPIEAPAGNPQAGDASEPPSSRPSALARYLSAVETSPGPADSGRAESAWLRDDLVVADVMTCTVVSVRDDAPFKQIIEALADVSVVKKR